MEAISLAIFALIAVVVAIALVVRDERQERELRIERRFSSIRERGADE